jgi:EAL domain-containing protein (putative c-di-GMP-specific phosphodiesterase class I)
VSLTDGRISGAEALLRGAVTQLKVWLDSGLPPMTMAVNLSSVQFRHPDLPELIRQILAEANMPPHYLELELTERVAMGDPLGITISYLVRTPR